MYVHSRLDTWYPNLVRGSKRASETVQLLKALRSVRRAVCRKWVVYMHTCERGGMFDEHYGSWGENSGVSIGHLGS